MSKRDKAKKNASKAPLAAAPGGGGAESASGGLVPGMDLEEDATHDVAPVGPTEPPPPETSEAPASSGAAPSPSSRRASLASGENGETVEALESQIRELEARLDRMLGRSEAPRPRESEPSPLAPPRDAGAPAGASQEALGRLGRRARGEDFDEFGLDPSFERRFLPLLDGLYRHYFRVDAEGTQNVPLEGRCLLVANHSGGPLPYDGLMLRTALRLERGKGRDLRWLAEDFVYYLPFVGAFMNRLGAVRACQENAERLLAAGRAVAVFPEGAKGIGKLYRDRYKLQRFGRGGFIRLCLRTGTPLVPCAVVGAEEGAPMLYRIEALTKPLGLPYIPVTPTFPALGPLGLLPAPTKWKIRFGEPMTFEAYGPEAAEDDLLVGRLAERVRSRIQGMLDRTVAERRSIWFG